MDKLQIALDAMHSMQAVFLHRYTLGSSVERRVGGQGLVQFASIAGTLDRVRNQSWDAIILKPSTILSWSLIGPLLRKSGLPHQTCMNT